MRLKGGLLGALMPIVGLLLIGSQPAPAVAFACSKAVLCTVGCKTELEEGGDYEGKHPCFTACSYPDCGASLAVLPSVNVLVQNASSGDIKAAVRLVTKYPLYVRYNPDRDALFYYSSCTGDVPIGVQPLSLEQSQAVAMALED